MKRRLAAVGVALVVLAGCDNAPWQGYSVACWPLGLRCSQPAPCAGIACGTVTP